MRVLYITQGYPAPEMVGGQISSFHRVGQLTRAGHEVTCLCLVPKAGALTEPDELERLCRVVPVRDVPDATLVRLALGAFDQLPWPARRYTSKAAAARAVELIGEISPDLVFFNSLHSAPLLPAVRRATDAPCLLMSPNVQSVIMKLFAEHRRGLPARLYATDQAFKMRRYEAEQAGRFDAVCVYSREDAEGLRALAPDVPVEVTPIALDLDAMGEPEEPRYDVLMTGSFEWPPNADSLEWFLRTVLPRLLEERPGTTVKVVGPGSERWRGRATPDGVSFVGRVDDIAPYFRTARVLVVPLRIGSGIRVKIVQAFGARLPVVSTAKGCEGLDVEGGRHLMIADEPWPFAKAVAGLLDDAERRAALAREARTLAEGTHDAYGERLPLVEVCERLAGGEGEGGQR